MTPDACDIQPSAGWRVVRGRPRGDPGPPALPVATAPRPGLVGPTALQYQRLDLLSALEVLVAHGVDQLLHVAWRERSIEIISDREWN